MASTHFHHQTDSRDSESSGQNTTGATYAGDSDVLPSEPNRDSEGLERNDFSRVSSLHMKLSDKYPKYRIARRLAARSHKFPHCLLQFVLLAAFLLGLSSHPMTTI